jgi:hypothetical protein
MYELKGLEHERMSDYSMLLHIIKAQQTASTYAGPEFFSTKNDD